MAGGTAGSQRHRPPVSQLHISGQGAHVLQTDTARAKMTRDSLLQRQCVAAVWCRPGSGYPRIGSAPGCPWWRAQRRRRTLLGPGSHSYVASIQVAVAGMLCSLRSAHWAGGWRTRAVVSLYVVIKQPTHTDFVTLQRPTKKRKSCGPAETLSPWMHTIK